MLSWLPRFRQHSRRSLTTFAACWGNGDWGRLGGGATCASATVPTRVQGLPSGLSVAQVSAGGAHSCFLLEDGSVWSCGLNERHQLGHSPGALFTHEARRVAVPRASSVSAGHHHTLCATLDGEVWAFGCNQHGQVGHAASGPQPVPELHGAIAVSAGARHSLVLDSDGSLFAFGARSLLGLGEAEGWWLRLARNEPTPRRLRALKGIVGLSAGAVHSTAIDESGRLFSWGDNAFFPLGRGGHGGEPLAVPGITGVVSVACGGLHTVAASSSGALWVFGANQNGCLGTGLKGSDQQTSPLQLDSLTDAHCVSAGWRHSAAIDARGQLHAWGWGGSDGAETGGQLGLGPGQDCDFWVPTQAMLPEGAARALQVSCGWNHTCGLFAEDA